MLRGKSQKFKAIVYAVIVHIVVVLVVIVRTDFKSPPAPPPPVPIVKARAVDAEVLEDLADQVDAFVRKVGG